MKRMAWLKPMMPVGSRINLGASTAARMALCFGCVFALAVLALSLTSPQLYSPLIYPPAGIGLAFVLLYGWSMLAAVFAANVMAGVLCELPGLAERTELVASLAAIACLQTAVGAGMVRRWAQWPNPLQSPRSILSFSLLAGPVACVVGPTLAIPLLLATGIVPADTVPLNALMWWLGDTLGVIVMAPLVFAFLAAPREHWSARRLTYAVPIVLCILVIGSVAQIRDNLERERVTAAFNHRAETMAEGAREQVRNHQLALNTLARQIEAQQMSSSLFRGMALEWLAYSRGLQAMAWIEMPLQGEQRIVQSHAKSELPLDWSAWLKHPGVIGGLRQSVAQSSAVTTGHLQLTADSPQAVFLLQVLQDDSAGTRSAILMLIDASALLLGSSVGQPAEIHHCLRDLNQKDPTLALLSGSHDCSDPWRNPQALPLALGLTTRLTLPARQWELTLTPSPTFVAANVRQGPLLAMFASMVSIALAALLLLVITGQTNAMRSQVAAQTAALREQLAQRAASAKALQRSESNWRRMVEMMPVGMVYLTLDGTLKGANPSACRLLGYQRDELEDMPILRLFDEQQLRVIASDFAAMRAANQSIWQGERSVIRKDGTRLSIHAHMILLRDQRGEPSMALTVFFDITAQKELHAATEARVLAEKANLAKSQFLSSMSHELRTPLNALLGFTQLMRTDAQVPLPPHQAQRLNYIEQAGWHLLRMIGDVLDLARMDNGHLQVQLVPANLGAVIGECVQMMSYEVETRGLELELSLPDPPLMAQIDALRMKQVLINVLSNAVKYNTPRGRVEVSAWAEAGQVQVLVSDTGIGISAEQQAHLFEPFNRLDQNTSAEPGTGIGLVISRNLVQAMGGQLHVSSEPGRGTTVSITLDAASANQLVDLDNRQKHGQHDQQNHAAHHENQQRL